MLNIPRLLVAVAIFIAALTPALPDTVVGSPRVIAQAVAMGLMGAAVYLGAALPLKPGVAAGAGVFGGLTRRDAAIAFVFTQVEILTLTAWLAVFVPSVLSNGYAAVGEAVLEVGLFTEHLISRLHG
jgi:hypothetical protein